MKDETELEERIHAILRAASIPDSLEEWKVERKDLKTLAALGLTKGRADNNPVELTPECIENILEDIYSAEKRRKENEKENRSICGSGSSWSLPPAYGMFRRIGGVGGNRRTRRRRRRFHHRLCAERVHRAEHGCEKRSGRGAERGACCEVEEIQASDYNAIIEALRTGKADMAYMGPLAIALGVERAGVEPIVMKADDGDPEKAVYHAVLVTSSANTDINSIADIKEKPWPSWIRIPPPEIWCPLPKSFRHFRRKNSIQICFIPTVSF